MALAFACTRTLTCSAHACVSVYVRVRAGCYCLLSFTSQGEDGLLRVSTVVMVRGGGVVVGDREKKKSSFDVPEEAVTDGGTVLGRKGRLYGRLKSYTGRQSDRPPG